MDPEVTALLVFCIVASAVAGCMGPADPAALPVPSVQATPAPAISPVPAAECSGAADCVPAECCHPSRCIPAAQKEACDLVCTASCGGSPDCGAGSCGCVNGRCGIIPASPAFPAPGGRTGISVTASPLLYSPFMSSTPGIGLEPVTTGFSAENATFAWKTGYGQFLSWDSNDFRIKELGNFTSNHGEKLYWSFIDIPSSTVTPVTITVTATDTASGRLLGSSTMTLGWEGNYTVRVTRTE